MTATSPAAAPPPALPRLSRRAFAIICFVSVTTAFGNTGLQTILPAIGREVGMPDTLVPAIFSLSALLWGISSPIWARQADRRGRKPMIALGLLGFTVSMFLCAVVVSVGLRHLLAPTTVFVLFLLARAIFGLVGSAANPASQAYVAERTTRAERTETMAGMAGAFGIGTVVGPFVAPAFILPGVSLAGPMFAFSAMALGMTVVVWRGLKEDRRDVLLEPPTTENRLTPEPSRHEADGRERGGKRVKGPNLWRDRRLAPFLIYGFLVASCQTVQGQTLGFLIIDKLHLAPLKAQQFIAVATGAGAVSGLLAQWGFIRMFRMGPRDLLRWGVGLAAAANLLVAFAPTYWAVVVGYALASLGYGFARPGFTAGASLSVDGREQARAAGAIASINGSSVIVAPVLGVWLYERFHPTPYLMNAAILIALIAYAFLNPTLRAVGDQPATDDDSAAAQMERNEEGGGSL